MLDEDMEHMDYLIYNLEERRVIIRMDIIENGIDIRFANELWRSIQQLEYTLQYLYSKRLNLICETLR